MPPPWLVTVPSAVDKTSLIAGKWNNTVPISVVSKIPLQIIIPAFTLNPKQISGNTSGVIAGEWQFAQFNYTAPSWFTLPTIPFDFINQQNIIYVIRYRVGNTCIRYKFPNEEICIETLGQPYAGQVIGPQFSIEIFQDSGSVRTSLTGQQIILNTSILYTPVGPIYPTASPQLTPLNQVSNDLFVTFPIVLPFNWPANDLWNSN